ncbi:MAG: alpha/beta fold hydrolase [Pseudomonadota bacterium]
MRNLSLFVTGLLFLGLLTWFFGPREPAVINTAFDPAEFAGDPAAYFARSETALGDVLAGAEKRILWANEDKGRTDWAILYIHGFSATSEEIRPVPDLVATGLNANLVFTRLTGHGRNGQAMAEATVEDWSTDLAEGLAAARSIGDRVLVIGTSTGGTLAAHVPFHDTLSEDVAGLVFVSPNFRLMDPLAFLLTWPFARTWLPWVAGPEREWEGYNDAHNEYWTTKYPAVAILPMAALVAHTGTLDWTQADIPALFLFSQEDQIVDPSETQSIGAVWAGAARISPQQLVEGSDPDGHLIAGDVLSPGMTQSVAAEIIVWAEGLGN